MQQPHFDKSLILREKAISRRPPNCTDITWEGRADCAHCLIRSQVLFGVLPPEVFEHLLGPIDTYRVAPHAMLYEGGQQGEALFTVRRGLIKLVHYLPNGSYRIVRLLRAGDTAGLGILFGEKYRHTAVVLYEAELCRIPRNVVMRLAEEHPELWRSLMLRMQKSLDAADTFIGELSTGSAEARVARLLLYLDGPTNGQPLPHISREDMGALLGITPETASRVMADFGRRKLITPISHDAYSYDRNGLSRVARDD